MRYGFAGDALAAGDAAVVGEGMEIGATVGDGDGWVSEAGADCKTERVPVTAGNDNISAISMKETAAPIVILAKSVCVPRGPKAVLETLLANRSPAPDFPGCRSMVTISTTHESMNKPYKR